MSFSLLSGLPKQCPELLEPPIPVRLKVISFPFLPPVLGRVVKPYEMGLPVSESDRSVPVLNQYGKPLKKIEYAFSFPFPKPGGDFPKSLHIQKPFKNMMKELRIPADQFGLFLQNSDFHDPVLLGLVLDKILEFNTQIQEKLFKDTFLGKKLIAWKGTGLTESEQAAFSSYFLSFFSYSHFDTLLSNQDAVMNIILQQIRLDLYRLACSKVAEAEHGNQVQLLTSLVLGASELDLLVEYFDTAISMILGKNSGQIDQSLTSSSGTSPLAHVRFFGILQQSKASGEPAVHDFKLRNYSILLTQSSSFALIDQPDFKLESGSAILELACCLRKNYLATLDSIIENRRQFRTTASPSFKGPLFLAERVAFDPVHFFKPAAVSDDALKLFFKEMVKQGYQDLLKENKSIMMSVYSVIPEVGDGESVDEGAVEYRGYVSVSGHTPSFFSRLHDLFAKMDSTVFSLGDSFIKFRLIHKANPHLPADLLMVLKAASAELACETSSNPFESPALNRFPFALPIEKASKDSLSSYYDAEVNRLFSSLTHSTIKACFKDYYLFLSQWLLFNADEFKSVFQTGADARFDIFYRSIISGVSMNADISLISEYILSKNTVILPTLLGAADKHIRAIWFMSFECSELDQFRFFSKVEGVSRRFIAATNVKLFALSLAQVDSELTRGYAITESKNSSFYMPELGSSIRVNLNDDDPPVFFVRWAPCSTCQARESVLQLLMQYRPIKPSPATVGSSNSALKSVPPSTVLRLASGDKKRNRALFETESE